MDLKIAIPIIMDSRPSFFFFFFPRPLAVPRLRFRECGVLVGQAERKMKKMFEIDVVGFDIPTFYNAVRVQGVAPARRPACSAVVLLDSATTNTCIDKEGAFGGVWYLISLEEGS